MKEITKNEVQKLYEQLKREAKLSGYHLNPDVDFSRDLVEGLLTNKQRYGYPACPCRLALGNKKEDLDIICPCDYRDADVVEYDACYCGLYVSDKAVKTEKQISSIPERRLPRQQRIKPATTTQPSTSQSSIPTNKLLPYPVWRCKVCGYLCAREQPPEICPICKVKKDRFERFI